METKKRSPWPWIIGLGIAGFLFMGFFMILLFFAALTGGFSGGAQIAVVHVRGMITGGGEISPLVAAVSAETVVKNLDKARKDPFIRAVVLRVDSPGGTVAGSQEIYDAILRFRRSRKKIVTSMSDLAASGGYYISSATDKIVAQRGTLTGSIGVIIQGMDIEGLMKKYGVRSNVVKSGKRKDMLSLYREMRPEERAYLQQTSDEIHRQFIRDVAFGRKNMKIEAVRRLADGSIFTGERAKALGLVDMIGGLHDSIREAGRMVGIKGEPSVVHYGKGVSLLELIMGEASQARSLLGNQAMSQIAGTLASRKFALPMVMNRWVGI